eukprot:maker-scaffold791_size96783-snap-gene-0.24 protein:Tk03152 transcript:maker-scaffold791_size96783-snap-gene-0.24-mRNA-1 annotation:"hypothetical protein TcasGA2_TC012994"
MEVSITERVFERDLEESQWCVPAPFPQWFQRLSHCFLEYFYSEHLTDINLICHNGQVRAHRLVLGLASPVLRHIVDDDFAREEDWAVLIPDYSVEMVQIFLESLYRGSIPRDQVTAEVCSALASLLGLGGQQKVIFDAEGPSQRPNEGGEENTIEAQSCSIQPGPSHDDPEPLMWVGPEGNPMAALKPPITKSRLKAIRANQKKSCSMCSDQVVGHRVRVPNSGLKGISEVFYECCLSSCESKRQRSAKALLAHIESHLKKSVESDADQCPVCFKSRLEHKNRDKEALKAKGPKKGAWYKCCHCSAARLSAKKFLDHVSNHIVKKFKCHICTKGYSHQYLLDEHIAMKHSDLSDTEKVDLTCSEENCGFQTHFRPTLLLHRRKFHPDPAKESSKKKSTLSTQPVTCPNCRKTLKQWYYNQYHRKTCSFGDMVYQCDVCHQDGFANKDTLENHIRALHTDERPFGCEYCPKRYATQMSLAGHRARVHNVNKAGDFVPKKMYPCETCGKLLTSRTKLLSHIRAIHENEKGFSCSFCPKRFTSKSNKQVHEGAVHTKNYPYTCSICAKGFIRKKALLLHLDDHGVNEKENEEEMANPVQITNDDIVSKILNAPGGEESIFVVEEVTADTINLSDIQFSA